MFLREPDYLLIDLGCNEWRFQESKFMQWVAERFDQIRESAGASGVYSSRLKRLIKEHPTHIDALHHYGLIQSSKGKTVDAYAFSHAAVAVGKSAFTEDFVRSKGRLPGGFVTNRPFLRALHGLMCAQAVLGDYHAAAKSGNDLIELDREDRWGARMQLISLPSWRL